MKLLAVTPFSSIQLDYGEKLREYEIEYLKVFGAVGSDRFP